MMAQSLCMCGATCIYSGDPRTPCSGQVTVADASFCPRHMCKTHLALHDLSLPKSKKVSRTRRTPNMDDRKLRERISELETENGDLRKASAVATSRMDGLAKAWPVLTEFVEAYRRETYRTQGMSDYATAEAYEAACKLLGRDP